VANKADLVRNRKVTEAQGRDLGGRLRFIVILIFFFFQYYS
jgi:hypothetical protein